MEVRAMHAHYARLLVIAAAAPALAWGCSSSSSPGGSGNTGDGGSSSGSSSGPSSGGDSGSYARCIPVTDAAADTCFVFPLQDGGSAAAVCAADTEDNYTWVSVPACPTAGLAGCCAMTQVTQCFYDEVDASTTESTCTQNGGTWFTISP
jgi:hypothetical protein